MNKVIVTDIFGRTPEIEDLAGTIGSVADIIDPYEKAAMNFAAEPLAYEYFMTHVGLSAYEKRIAARLAETVRIDLLIGFSVGAAAIWRLSSNLTPEKIVRAVCFYGSQIRHSTDRVPRIPIDHILPGKEPGFDIDGLAEILSAKPTVSVHKTPFLHGFMNRLSPNFSQTGYDAWLDRLRRYRL